MNEFTTQTIVWAIFCAVTVGAVYAFVMQKTLNGFAKRLMKKCAYDKQSAQTLEQLGYKSGAVKGAVRFFASGGSRIARAIEKIGSDSENAENGKDSAAEKYKDELLFTSKSEFLYYLPEDRIDKNFKKHVEQPLSVPKLAGLLCVLLVFAISATYVIDFLAGWAGDIVTDDGSSGAYGVEGNDKDLLEEQEQLNQDELLGEKDDSEISDDSALTQDSDIQNDEGENSSDNNLSDDSSEESISEESLSKENGTDSELQNIGSEDEPSISQDEIYE